MSTRASGESMHPNRMRSMDTAIGVPLCWLLSIVARLSAPAPPTNQPKRVLIIELAEMGSTVFTVPAVRRLRERHPGCEVYFLAFAQIGDGVRALGLVPDDHLLTIDASSLVSLVRDTWRVVRAARRLGIDTVINLEMFARFSTLLGYLSGATRRVGFYGFTQSGLYTGELLTHRVIYNAHLHTWQSFAALVDAIDAPPGNLPLGKFPAVPFDAHDLPMRRSDPAAIRAMRDRIERALPSAAGRRLVVINPNASKLLSIRKWPLDRYIDLTRQLIADPRIVCAITGSASEVDDARAIVDGVRSDRVLDLAGQTSLSELLDLFEIADVLVTNDSGPAQFAALTPVHVIVLFGPETPALYRPLTERSTVLYAGLACSPCVSAYNQRRTACNDNQCLTAISVEAVRAETMRILESRPHAAAQTQ